MAVAVGFAEQIMSGSPDLDRGVKKLSNFINGYQSK
jgi:hypothetical protein